MNPPRYYRTMFFRFLTTSLSFLLILGIVSSANADVITIEVVIKSVDAKGRTISAIHKNKTLELDVSRKAEVIINSKAGKLDALAAGQQAKIDYETSFEIITKIDATGSPLKNATDPLSLIELSELNSGTYTADPWISLDGLIIYWHSEGYIWTAQRKNKDSLFEKKQKLLPGRHATVAADGLQMILLAPRSDGQKGESLYQTTRSSVDKPFLRPREIRELKNVPKPKNPCLSPDGLSLYFNRAQNQRSEIAYTTRKSLRSPWSPSRSLSVEAESIDGVLTWPFVLNDGLTMLCTVEPIQPSGKSGNLVVLSRKSTTAPFENPHVISGNDLAPIIGRSPRYVISTGELVFARFNGPNAFSLMMVRNLDLEDISLPRE